MSRVLVISPHPDDESIGCGGTLHRHATKGDAVHILFLTSGEKGGHGRSPEETVRLREAEAKAAAAILGVAEIEFWREPDGRFRATKDTIDRLCARLNAWKPQTIYVPHDREDHPDHRCANRLVRRALDNATLKAAVPMVLMYEVWTPMQQVDEVVDISKHLEVKLAAIRAYKSQCAVMRFDEAIIGLNRYRGEMHNEWRSGDYAEIFMGMK